MQDQVRPLLQAPPSALHTPEDWRELSDRYRGQSDPGFFSHERVSYEQANLAHSPWSVDAIIRSSLQGQAAGLTVRSSIGNGQLAACCVSAPLWPCFASHVQLVQISRS